jgi:VanZ family protein
MQPIDLRPARAQIRRIAIFMRTLTVVVLVGMFLGTHLPVSGVRVVSHLDKLFHFGAYFTLTLCLLASWELSRGTLQAAHYFMVWLFGTLYGIFDEVTQIPVGRTCDGYDWLADVAGIIVGLILFQAVSSLAPRFLRWNRAPALSGAS